jgi:CheY-like chemotaxis protein
MERILVIDDDNGILDSVSKVLKYSGYEVEVAHDGEEGVRLFGIAHSFDCVVTDINMPKMNGNEVAERIRNSERADIPLIAISGFGEDGINKALFNASLPKPFKLKTLIGLIRALVNNSKGAKGSSIKNDRTGSP